MPLTFTTSSPIQAICRGLLAALGCLAFLWAAGLPLDWRFCLILTVTIGIPMAFYFYTGTPVERHPPHTEIVMGKVQWDFTEPVCVTLEEFISTVASRQSTETGWTPHETLPVRGPLDIQFAQYHDENQPEVVLTLNPIDDSEWTHASLLNEIHKALNQSKGLQGATFFEGLVKCGHRRYHLLLGS